MTQHSPSPAEPAPAVTPFQGGPRPTAGVTGDQGGPDVVFPTGYVVGRSPSMSRVHRELAAVAAMPVPVLLVGETGVGKEYLARIIHASSPRARRALFALNCAAIPADLLEAELFGIEAGTATGVRARRGHFREAEGGTLFLDEVGEMPPALQAKLLRALQEREVRPIGGTPVAVDVRVVSATNADLARRRREGSFRDDLYYRLAGFVVRVPPLRERREDVPILTQHFVRAHAAEVDKRIQGVTEEVLQFLVDSPWPGNVRQLEHEVRRLVYLTPDGGWIGTENLSREVLQTGVETLQPDVGAASGGQEGSAGSLDLNEHVARLERRLIRLALVRTGGAIAPAARLLGISRNGLKMKCRRLGVPL